MKKLLALALTIATLLVLVSCGEITTPVASGNTSTAAATAKGGTGTVSTEQTDHPADSTSTTSRQTGNEPTELFSPSGYSLTNTSKAVQMRSKILLLDTTGVNSLETVYYYSKADGDIYPFCFDPFCNHENWDEKRQINTTKCIGQMLYSDTVGVLGTKPVYVNSRLYFAMANGGRVYSCSEIATDLRLEFEMFTGMSDREFREIYLSKTNAYPIADLTSDGNFLFFKYLEENGNIAYYIYDTVSRKLKRLSDKIEKLEQKENVKIVVRDFADGVVYFDKYGNVSEIKNDGTKTIVTGDYIGYFSADYEFEKTNKIEMSVENAYVLAKTSKGNICTYSHDGKEDLILLKYSGEHEIIVGDIRATLGAEWNNLIYLTDDSLYFTKTEQKVVGMMIKPSTGTEIDKKSNIDGKIYKYDRSSGKISIVYEDDELVGSYYIEYINENENVAVLVGKGYRKTGYKNEVEQITAIVRFEIDKNGLFVDKTVMAEN